MTPSFFTISDLRGCNVTPEPILSAKGVLICFSFFNMPFFFTKSYSYAFWGFLRIPNIHMPFLKSENQIFICLLQKNLNFYNVLWSFFRIFLFTHMTFSFFNDLYICLWYLRHIHMPFFNMPFRFGTYSYAFDFFRWVIFICLSLKYSMIRIDIFNSNFN